MSEDEQDFADRAALENETAPLQPPEGSTDPNTPDLAATAPLAAPSPVPEQNLAATAPLAAPKPVPRAAATPEDDDKPALYYRRTKNFPKWSTVEPLAQGEFLIEFETRNVDERRLEISIVDKLERLELRAFVNRGKREAARKRRVLGVFGAGAVLTVVAYFGYAPIVPLVIVGTMAGVAALMLSNDEADESPEVELTIDPEQLVLVHRDEFRLRASPRDARWYLQNNTDLMLATDREAPVLELSREARIQSDWFWTYVQARCQEIGSRRGFAGQPAVQPGEEPTVETAKLARPAATEQVPGPSGTQLMIGVSNSEPSEVDGVATEEVPLSKLSAPTLNTRSDVTDVETQEVSLETLSSVSSDQK